MTDLVVSQVGLEAWVKNEPSLVVTQAGVEVWVSNSSNLTVTQAGVELWRAVDNVSPLVEPCTATDTWDATYAHGLLEICTATDTWDALYTEAVPRLIEVCNARDTIDAYVLGSGGPIRATQVVMEVLMPARAGHKPFVQINT